MSRLLRAIAGLCSQGLSSSPAEIERQANHLIGCLPVVAEKENVARFGCELLLDRKLPVPDDRLVEERDDLLAVTGRGGGGSGAGRRLRVNGCGRAQQRKSNERPKGTLLSRTSKHW